MNAVTSSFKEKLECLQAQIDAAAKKGGRSLKDVTLVAVTKGVPAEVILQATAAGVRVLGENKVQEAEAKIPQLEAGLEWHMIGHLQTNKVKTALSLFNFIQSVDSVRLAKAIENESAQLNKTASVLLEINISGEAQKYGFKPEEVYTAIEEIAEMPHLKVLGLMGIGPNGVTDEVKRESFKKLRNVFSVCKALKRENLEMRYLSMGMSDDFKIAVEEGSNMVRIGRALFK